MVYHWIYSAELSAERRSDHRQPQATGFLMRSCSGCFFSS